MCKIASCVFELAIYFKLGIKWNYKLEKLKSGSINYQNAESYGKELLYSSSNEVTLTFDKEHE